MKRVLVTGSSRGIGLFIAKKLIEAGNKVVITGRDDIQLKTVSGKINSAGYVAVDFFQQGAVKKVYKQCVDILGGVDVLVNNAGLYLWASIENSETNDIEKILKVNLEVPIELSALVVKGMKTQRWGRIINIGSISGAVGEANASVYSASKGGLIGLSKSLALELAEYNITVNIINPGWVKTDMTLEHLGQEELEMIPQKRYIEPEEIAELVEYLVSDSARGITGQGVNLCCGLSLG